jgi:hypothetical protein
MLGGVASVSARLSLPRTTVSNWKVRGSIPARYHLALIHLSDGKITGDQIATAHAGKSMVEPAT